MPMPPNVNAAFDAANAIVVAIIAEGLANLPSLTQSTPLIEDMSIDDSQVNFQFLLDNNGLQELRRNIEKKAAIKQQVSIFSKEWIDNLTVRTTDLNERNGDMYRMQAQTKMRGVPRWMDQQVAKLLRETTGSAFTVPSFDGKPYFATDHPMDLAGENISAYGNLDSGGGGKYWYAFDTKLLKPILLNWKTRVKETHLGPDSEHASLHFEVMWNLYAEAGFGMGLWYFGHASNQALDETHYEAVRLKMEAVPTYAKSDDAEQVMGVLPDTVVVGRSNRLAAEKLFERATVNGGDPNPMYQKAKVVYLPYLP